MPTDFTGLKRSSQNALEAYSQQAAKLTQGNFQQDERYWQPVTDKGGNGTAIIRFLPPPKGEEVPFVRKWSHNFKGPTGEWYIENCLTTLGKDDPVAQLNSELWNSTEEDDSPARKQARNQKRKLGFICNILVISHAGRKDDEGKVFLFGFGKKIWDKIGDAMNPPEGLVDENGNQAMPFNPFDFWEGANFFLDVRKVEGYRNYDKSRFLKRGPVSADDSVIQSVWEKQYSLSAEIAPSKFKSYDELKAKLDRVLKGKPAPLATPGGGTGSAPKVEKPAENMTGVAPTIESAVVDSPDEAGETDEMMKFFQTLGEGKDAGASTGS